MHRSWFLNGALALWARVPGMTMLIGADVFYGLQDLRHYNGEKAKRRQMFETLAGHGAHFLVAGRAVDGLYETLGDILVSGNVAPLFAPLVQSSLNYAPVTCSCRD